MNAKVITFAHSKGGTGKTSTCISIAGYLAKAGKKVLVVDIDPQGNATSGLGIDKNSLDGSMFGVMNEKTGISNVILKTDIENIHLAPATLSLMQTDMNVHGNKNDALLLNNVLNDVKKYYEYVLIDAPPGQGHLIINAALASDEIVLVLDPGIFALEGIESLQRVFEEYGRKVGKEIEITTVVLTKCRNSWLPFLKNPTKEIGEELKRLYRNVFLVPYSDKIYESQLKGIPISHYKPKSNVGVSYEKIAEAVLVGVSYEKIAEAVSG